MTKTKYYPYIGGGRRVEVPEPHIPEDYTIMTIGREVQEIRILLTAVIQYIRDKDGK